ncbi:hypothetical protein ACLB2K_031508 [Fragaria x ananassa]
MCCHLLSKKPVALPSLSSTLSNIWGLKEKVWVHQEDDDVLLFQFKDIEIRDRVLSNGPLFYNNSMLLSAAYNGLSALDSASLYLLEVWVVVTGLRIAMRNEKALTFIGRTLGEFVCVNPMVVQHKEVTQKVRMTLDIRRRGLRRRRFMFLPDLSLVLDLQSECFMFSLRGSQLASNPHRRVRSARASPFLYLSCWIRNQLEIQAIDCVTMVVANALITMKDLLTVQRAPTPPKESRPMKDHVIKSKKGWKKMKLVMEGSSAGNGSASAST